MIKLTPLALVTSAAVLMSGCVIAPLPAPHTVRVQPMVVEPIYAAPSGVVYLQPTYVMPAPGYVWQYHANYGWGWRHPNYGWHRGWR